MAQEIQRAVSIATVKELPGGMWEPIISHIYGHELSLTPQPGQLEATAYIHAVWPRIQLRWLTYGKEWFAALREEAPAMRTRAA